MYAWLSKAVNVAREKEHPSRQSGRELRSFPVLLLPFFSSSFYLLLYLSPGSDEALRRQSE